MLRNLKEIPTTQHTTVPQAWAALATALEQDDALAMLAGNAQPPGGTLASAYSGHQFGNYSPRLGDGRALLLGEVVTVGTVAAALVVIGSVTWALRSRP